MKDTICSNKIEVWPMQKLEAHTINTKCHFKSWDMTLTLSHIPIRSGRSLCLVWLSSSGGMSGRL